MRHAAISRGAQACGAKVAKHAVGESAPYGLNADAETPSVARAVRNRNEVRSDSCREYEAVSGFLGDSPKLH